MTLAVVTHFTSSIVSLLSSVTHVNDTTQLYDQHDTKYYYKYHTSLV